MDVDVAVTPDSKVISPATSVSFRVTSPLASTEPPEVMDVDVAVTPDSKVISPATSVSFRVTSPLANTEPPASMTVELAVPPSIVTVPPDCTRVSLIAFSSFGETCRVPPLVMTTFETTSPSMVLEPLMGKLPKFLNVIDAPPTLPAESVALK